MVTDWQISANCINIRSISSLLTISVQQRNHSTGNFSANKYGECSKISNTFLFLFSNKMLTIKAGIRKMLVRIAKWEDPDQTASSEAV